MQEKFSHLPFQQVMIETIFKNVKHENLSNRNKDFTFIGYTHFLYYYESRTFSQFCGSP